MENFYSKKGQTSFIAIINQKGGVGKSTVTTLLANIFYFIFNKQVAIIDADFPQQTIYKRHIDTAEEISKKPLVRKATELLYKDRSPIHIYPTEISNAQQIMEELDGKVDLVFLDIAGTLNQTGIVSALKKVNHFFIPVLQDNDTLKSSTEFYQVLAEAILPQSEAVQSCQFFLNNLPFMNQGKHYRKKLEKEGVAVLENELPHYVVYERAFRSTLLPIPTTDESKMYQKEITKLHRFATEVLSRIEGTIETGLVQTETPKLEQLGLHESNDTTASNSTDTNTLAA